MSNGDKMADSKKGKKAKKDNRKVVCKICGNSRGLIRKYNIYLCRRCFKENAEKLGFKKLE